MKRLAHFTQRLLGRPAQSSILFGCLLATVPTLTTVAQHDLPATAEAGLEMNGLVIDETITKMGRDFYELFYARWEPPTSSLGYTLHIKELPQPGRGTRISVLLNETELLRQAIQSREELLLAVANRAIQLAYYHIQHHQQMAQQLENEDQYGNGIY